MKKIIALIIISVQILAFSVSADGLDYSFEEYFTNDLSNWNTSATTDYSSVTINDGKLDIWYSPQQNGETASHTVTPYAYTNTSYSDFTLEAKVDFDAKDEYAGIVFRYTDSSSYYALVAGRRPTELYLAKNGLMAPITGAKVAYSSIAGYTWSDLNTYKIAAYGNRIKVYVNGGTEPVIDYTDSSPLTSGSAGIMANSGWQTDLHIYADDFRIYNEQNALTAVTADSIDIKSSAAVDVDVLLNNNNISVEFAQEMLTDNYSSITLYNEETKEIVPVTVVEQDTQKIIFKPLMRLESATRYLLDFGVQQTADGMVLRDLMPAGFTTEADLVKTTASLTDNPEGGYKLDVSCAFQKPAEVSTALVLYCVYENNKMTETGIKSATHSTDDDFHFIIPEKTQDFDVVVYTWDSISGGSIYSVPVKISQEVQ